MNRLEAYATLLFGASSDNSRSRGNHHRGPTVATPQRILLVLRPPAVFGWYGRTPTACFSPKTRPLNCGRFGHLLNFTIINMIYIIIVVTLMIALEIWPSKEW